MKYVILISALLAGPAMAQDDCEASLDLYDTYTSTLDFVLAFSQSCETKPTSTCAEVIEPLNKLIGSMAEDNAEFISALRSKCR